MARYIDVEKIELKGILVFDENLDVLVPLSDVRKAIQMTPTADVAPKSEVVKTLSDIKRQIHEKAIYPHNAGIKPYISLGEIDAIIQAEMRKHKGGEDHV